MFRFCVRRLGVSPYALFLKEQKNNPKLKGLAIGDRGKLTAKLYRQLSPAEKAMLEKRAKNVQYGGSGQRKTAAAPAAPKPKKAKGTRAPSAYATFVKQNIGKFEALPHRDRMKAVAELWRRQKGR